MSGQGGNIECIGLVRMDGKPFVETRLDGRKFGQLSPREAMAMGTRFIAAAIEAERDCGVVRGLLDEGKSTEEIAVALTTIRKYRDNCDPDEAACINHPRFPQ